MPVPGRPHQRAPAPSCCVSMSMGRLETAPKSNMSSSSLITSKSLIHLALSALGLLSAPVGTVVRPAFCRRRQWRAAARGGQRPGPISEHNKAIREGRLVTCLSELVRLAEGGGHRNRLNGHIIILILSEINSLSWYNSFTRGYIGTIFQYIRYCICYSIFTI